MVPAVLVMAVAGGGTAGIVACGEEGTEPPLDAQGTLERDAGRDSPGATDASIDGAPEVVDASPPDAAPADAAPDALG